MDQVGSLSAVRASETPKRFWLWSKYGPSGPLLAPGQANPRPSHISLLFSWLQNASGYQSRWGSFFSLIFTHKMCISRTKGAMMGPPVFTNFLSILSRNSCTAFILFTLTFSTHKKTVCINRLKHLKAFKLSISVFQLQNST